VSIADDEIIIVEFGRKSLQPLEDRYAVVL